MDNEQKKRIALYIVLIIAIILAALFQGKDVHIW